MPMVDENQALSLLEDQQLVALPTETVYGLAGRADSEEALKKIFSTKSRPFYDPLIVHFSDLNQATAWAEFDEVSEKLAQQFWPGPLTLVLPKKEGMVSDLITNGGPTVALRSPQHPLFQSILKKLPSPLAAPSANLFGRTSPTTAQHVIDEFNDQVPVLDGGACEMGIESTVAEVSLPKKSIVILRPGHIHHEVLEGFITENQLDGWQVLTQSQSHSPGHLKNHYQPTAPLLLIENSQAHEDFTLSLPTLEAHNPNNWHEMRVPDDPTLAARELYSQLRSFSERHQAFYIRVPSSWQQQPSWQAYLDRIEKASVGRMVKQEGQWQVHWKPEEKSAEPPTC